MRKLSMLALISFLRPVKLIPTRYNSAYFRKISTASLIVLFTGLTSKLGWNILCSSMFLSKRSLTYDKSSLAVVNINSASCFLGECFNSFKIDAAKLIMHFKGVNNSCVTVDVNMLKILFAS